MVLDPCGRYDGNIHHCCAVWGAAICRPWLSKANLKFSTNWAISCSGLPGSEGSPEIAGPRGRQKRVVYRSLYSCTVRGRLEQLEDRKPAGRLPEEDAKGALDRLHSREMNNTSHVRDHSRTRCQIIEHRVRLRGYLHQAIRRFGS